MHLDVIWGGVHALSQELLHKSIIFVPNRSWEDFLNKVNEAKANGVVFVDKSIRATSLISIIVFDI